MVESLNNALSAFQQQTVDSVLTATKANFQPTEATSTDAPGELLNNFGSILNQQMDNVNKLQGQADQAMKSYSVGESVDLHTVMIAAEKAELALEFTMQLRNKLVQAYQEINRMNV